MGRERLVGNVIVGYQKKIPRLNPGNDPPPLPSSRLLGSLPGEVYIIYRVKCELTEEGPKGGVCVRFYEENKAHLRFTKIIDSHLRFTKIIRKYIGDHRYILVFT